MAEANSMITNVLAVAIAVTALGTGGKPQSGEQVGKGIALSDDSPLLQSVQTSPLESLYASALPDNAVTERKRSVSRPMPETEKRKPRTFAKDVIAGDFDLRESE